MSGKKRKGFLLTLGLAALVAGARAEHRLVDPALEGSWVGFRESGRRIERWRWTVDAEARFELRREDALVSTLERQRGELRACAGGVELRFRDGTRERWAYLPEGEDFLEIQEGSERQPVRWRRDRAVPWPSAAAEMGD